MQLAGLEITPFEYGPCRAAGSLAQWQRGLPQTFIRFSRVPEDKYSIEDIARWISAIFSRDFLDLVSVLVGMKLT